MIFGILNITTDSFSDGGNFFAPEAAIAQGEKLVADGADVVDIGAAASNPRAAFVPPEIEVARLASIVPSLKAKGIAISVDSFAPEVQAYALRQGVDYLNDIHGFAEPSLYPELAASNCRLIVMHMVQKKGVATAADVPSAEIFDRATAFFERRLAAFEAAGIERRRLILDPGMGFFLGRDAENSFEMLRRLPDLEKRFGLPMLVSVSRKSFLRFGRPPGEAGSASLAAELYAGVAGANHIRTHDPAALRAALKVLKAIGPSSFGLATGGDRT